MQRISKHAVVLGAIVSLSWAGVAQAETDTTSAELLAGSVTMTAPAFGDFTSTTLNGASQSKTASVSDWGINDATGSGAGWLVTMAASPLQTGAAVVMQGATLEVAAATAAPVDASNVSTAPTMVGGDLRAGTVTVADAAADEGLGEWALTQGADDLTLGIPADARAGTYTSTITTTLAPGVL